MPEQIMTKESAPAGRAMTIIRKIAQWGILAMLLFTCIMAAYRKFGG